MRREIKHSITKTILPVLLGSCSDPDNCEVVERTSGSDLEITVMPSVGDYSILCGKKGRQVKAWKYVVETAGLNMGMGAVFELEEGFKGEPRRRGEFVPNADFTPEPFLTNVRQLGMLVLGPDVEMTHRQSGEFLWLWFNAPQEKASFVEAIHDVVIPYGFANGIKLRVEMAATVRP